KSTHRKGRKDRKENHVIAFLGSTVNHSKEPSAASPAATRNDASHPHQLAISGVTDAVIAAPVCPIMFMTPETAPADGPAMSELTDQKALCEIYRAPAPPARITLASRASWT